MNVDVNKQDAEKTIGKTSGDAEASAEEIRKAKELLRANGYGLFGYREAGEKVKNAVGSGLELVKEKGRSLGGWFSAKCDELKARQEERKRASAEKKRLADEAAGCAITSGVGAADGSTDAPKCAACGEAIVTGARFCRKCGKPVPAPAAKDASPQEEPAKTDSAKADKSAAVAPAEAQKCAECGAQLAPGMKFCGECGTPVDPVSGKHQKRKRSEPRKTSRKTAEQPQEICGERGLKREIKLSKEGRSASV